MVLREGQSNLLTLGIGRTEKPGEEESNGKLVPPGDQKELST